MDRRGFLKAGLTSAALLPVAGTIFAARIARAEEETSAKPDQNCANCQLYTPGADGKGKCQLFQLGVVPDGGWCMSWTKKVS
jgi:hypothetical protein